MTGRVLVVGGTPERQRAMASVIDAAFDVDVETAGGALEAMRRLPNASFGLIIVFAAAEPGEAPGLDLVRFLATHARHARTPTALVGGNDAEREAARAVGALVLDAAVPDADLRALVQDLLGIG